jgi:hypothetical protein
MDFGPVLLVPDLPIEIGDRMIAVGNQAYQNRDAPF